MQEGSDGGVVLRIRTLGTFSVCVGNTVLSNSSPRASNVWKLFKYMLVNRSQPVSIDKLIDMLWPDGDCENPLKALYTLMYRLRSILRKGCGDRELILFQHNSYLWNPDVPCWIDADEFASLCKGAEDQEIGIGNQIDLYREALALYTGDYLTDSAYENWVISISGYYKRMYTSAVLNLCKLYASAEDYGKIVATCERAIELNPYEETLHEMMIRALIHMDQISQGIAQYEYIAQLLYKELGVQPSEALQTLYRQMHHSEEDVQYDLQSVKNNLKENNDIINGALFCEIDVFRQIYRLQCRSMERSGQSIYLVLISLLGEDHRMPPSAVLNDAFAVLKRVIILGLRRGDVVSQYSKSQLVILLMNAAYEDCESVVARLSRTFRATYRKHPVQLRAVFEPLEPIK
ncbi:BTAD domain-containing putative transcriptional regulator [Gehongia tenuis]|uniref:Bacterial transcriptional activator domain-containing protein n=1 Tax=Gehongia tenuis TaxID=2763655 RepID=A0A926HQA6_9FIRM|nr:BTAD domain-containing putative transcriptional regulator [Gehongia tenuis]MBC8532023.1 hypothetical protein [Gehongia tenuis]